MTSILQLKSGDYRLKDVDPKGTVVLMANAFNIEDSHGDISLRGSFTKTLKESFSRVKYLFNHDVTKVIGVPVEGWETDSGLMIKAVLNLEKPIGMDTYLDYKHAMEYGRSVEHSVAVRAIKSQGRSPRYVSEWLLGEISYTPLRGANPNTPLIELKSEDKAFIEYCYNKGDGYSDCRRKFYESLLEPHSSLEEADDEVINFLSSLKF